MAAEMIRALMVLVLLAVAGTARGQNHGQDRGQDEMTQGVYASIQNDIRREYDAVMDRISRRESDGSGPRLDKIRQMWTMIFYNRAALFSNCTAEAEQYRSPGAPRVPAGSNLFLTTCLEERLGALTKFRNMFSYASTFFPDRIERCGEVSRLREQEELLPPYDFLQPAEPKLYDFPRYNECLMKAEPTSPEAR
jgi:hypothetical protein